jgi:hypothetical protein
VTLNNGPSTDTHLAEITMKGNSYQRGFQYGKTFKEYLEAFYGWFVGKEPREILTEEYLRILKIMEETTAKHYPQLLEELKGWADGSKLPYDKCRILGFHNEIKNILSPGCSNIAVKHSPEGPWLALTSDLFENERSWQVMKISLCDDGLSTAGVSYVGLPGVKGVNSAGLAIGGSSLPAQAPKVKNGLPHGYQFLLSTQRSVKDCLDILTKYTFLGKGVHLLLFDGSENLAAVECGGGTVHIRRADHDDFLVVTNHSVSGAILPPDKLEQYIENSQERYGRLMELLADTPPDRRTVEFAQQAMGDHQRKWSICEHVPNGFHTIYSLIVIPRSTGIELRVCWGYPCKNKFKIYKPF